MGSLCTGKPATTSNSTSYSPAGLSNINDIWNTVQSAAATPYQPYGGQLVAPVNQQQTQGTNTINATYGNAFPYITQAGNYANSASQPISSNAISSYLNPYTSSVINATQNQFNQSNAQQQSQLLGNAAAQGALGGDRSAVAQAILAGQQQTAQAPVIANLNAQNYNQALSAAQADRAAQLASAGTLGGLGTTAANVGLSTGAAQLGAGTLQQQTQQAQDTAAYQQYLQQMGYPFQTAQFLASYGLPVATAMGGTQTGTSQAMPSQSSPFSQILGAGLGIAGLFLKDGGRIPKYANGKTLEYKKNSEGNWNWQPYADGGSIVSPFSASSYVPVAPFAPVATPNQIRQVQSAGSPGASSSLPSAQQLYGGFKGAQNIFDSLGASSSGVDPGAIGALGSGFSLARGGVVGMVHEMRRALKKYADGGDVIANDFAAISPYTIGGSSPSLPSTISQIPTNLDFGSAGFGSAPSQPVTGTEAIPLARSQDITTPTNGYEDNMLRYGKVIGNMESSGDYSQLGPPTKSGDRAYGKYGVMGANIPEWTTEVLGKPLTPQQFLSNPQAQDTVFRAKFGQYVNKYGPEGAAKAWFAGPNGMWNPGASDVLGTTVASYGNKFMSALGGSPDGTDVASIPQEAQPAQYTTPLSARPTASASPPGILSSLFGGKGLSDDARMALLSAGLGILGSNSPYALQAIGQGGSQGLQSYLQQRNLRRQYEMQQQELALRGQQLAQQAKLAQLPYEKMTAAQKVTTMQPRIVAQDILGHPIYGVPGPNGQYRDPITGKPISAQTMTGANAAGPQAEVPQQTYSQWVKDFGQNGADLLKGYPPLVRNNVLGLISGDISPSSLSYRDRGNYINLASAVEPSFNTYTAPMRAQAAKAFSTGRQGDQIRFFNNAVQHLDTLRGLITGLGNNDIQALNAAKNVFKNQFGYTAPGDFNAAKAIVGQEIVKAIVANGGGEREREEAAQQLSAAKSAPQLNAIIDTYTHLMGAQLRDLKVQYENAGLKNFEGKLIPESRDELAKIEQHAAQRDSAAPAKPSRVQQGGHIYELQADGTYKAVQ